MLGCPIPDLQHSKSDILQTTEGKTDTLYFFYLDLYTQVELELCRRPQGWDFLPDSAPLGTQHRMEEGKALLTYFTLNIKIYNGMLVRDKNSGTTFKLGKGRDREMCD